MHLVAGISETFEETDEEAAIKSEMVDRNSEEAARLSNEGMHGSFKEAPSEAMRQLDGPDASVRIILDNSKMGLASHELSIDGSNSIQQGIANIQRGLANINVTSMYLLPSFKKGLTSICQQHEDMCERIMNLTGENSQ